MLYLQSNQLFREIARHRQLVAKQKNLFQLFCAAFDVTDNLNQISLLQKEFIITELGFSYSHFGYCLFATPAIFLAKKGLSQLCAVDMQFVEKYMSNLKDFLSDEIQIEKREQYFSRESIEFSFAREFVKRIFCTENEEDIQTGMFVFDKNYLERVRNISRKCIENEYAQKEKDELKEILYYETIYNEFVAFLQNLKLDPLVLIASRFDSFINFFKFNADSFFVYRENNVSVDEKSRRITALLALLVQHKHKQGELLFKNTMLTVKQITKVLSPKFKSNFFNLQPIQSWLDVNNGFALSTEIEFLMEEAIKCGVAFKVPQGNKGFSYGLSESGMRIIQPFHSILTESLSVT